MRTRYMLCLVAAAALTAAAACGRTAEKSAAAPERLAVAVDVYTAAPSDVVEGIEVVGTLAPKFQADIKSEISGRVAEVLVIEWARVKKGDPLARIDTSEMEVQLHKARAAVEAARAAGETARANSRTAQANSRTAQAAVETARAGLAEAKVASERALREYNRLKGLKESGLVTQQALDEAATQRDAADARAGTLATQVAASEAQQKVAEAQIQAAEAQVRAAEAQESVAAEEVRAVETRAGKAVVRAPFDGTVAERLVNQGEVVGEQQKVIFRLVDPRRLELTVPVPSREMAGLRVGEELTFTSDAFPGRAFTGKVAWINPVVSEADRSVKVTAEIANDPEVLKGGLFVQGTIATGRRTGVIRVPRSALFNWDVAAKTADLYIVEGETARRRSIKVGAVMGELAEAADGLAAGDRVVVRGGFNLKEGDRVTVAAGGRG